VGDRTEAAPKHQVNIHFSMEREKTIMNELGTGFFVHKRNISLVKRVEFVSDRMSYIILRGLWCHIIVLNVYDPTRDKMNWY
jgi:hypothetical protein